MTMSIERHHKQLGRRKAMYGSIESTNGADESVVLLDFSDTDHINPVVDGKTFASHKIKRVMFVNHSALNGGGSFKLVIDATADRTFVAAAPQSVVNLDFSDMLNGGLPATIAAEATGDILVEHVGGQAEDYASYYIEVELIT